MVDRLFSALSGVVSARFAVAAIAGGMALAALPSASQAASINVLFKSVSGTPGADGTTIVQLPGFSGAAPGTIQSALNLQGYLQFTASTTTGLTVTAPTAASFGSTNIVQPYIYTSVLNGSTVATGYNYNDYIGPNVAGKTLTAITSPTLLESTDGVGMFAAGTTHYIGFDFGNIAPDGKDYWGWVGVTVNSASTSSVSASMQFMGYGTVGNTPLYAGTLTDAPAVPEPAALSVIGLGAAGMLVRRRSCKA